MPRKIKSPTRTISNAGEHPRFIGLLTSPKAATEPVPTGDWGVLQYDSLSAMLCALYLEWRTDVVRFSFEPRRYRFESNGDLASLDCIPDFEAVLATGEVRVVEAKYSPDQMREKERSKLALTAAHFECAGIPYEVVYRLELERHGFIDTVFLLRQYGHHPYAEALLNEAERRLANTDRADLWEWRRRAATACVPTAVLYHLLYWQRLPLEYRSLQFEELQLWRA